MRLTDMMPDGRPLYTHGARLRRKGWPNQLYIEAVDHVVFLDNRKDEHNRRAVFIETANALADDWEPHPTCVRRGLGVDVKPNPEWPLWHRTELPIEERLVSREAWQALRSSIQRARPISQNDFIEKFGHSPLFGTHDRVRDKRLGGVGSVVGYAYEVNIEHDDGESTLVVRSASDLELVPEAVGLDHLDRLWIPGAILARGETDDNEFHVVTDYVVTQIWGDADDYQSWTRDEVERRFGRDGWRFHPRSNVQTPKGLS